MAEYRSKSNLWSCASTWWCREKKKMMKNTALSTRSPCYLRPNNFSNNAKNRTNWRWMAYWSNHVRPWCHLEKRRAPKERQVDKSLRCHQEILSLFIHGNNQSTINFSATSTTNNLQCTCRWNQQPSQAPAAAAAAARGYSFTVVGDGRIVLGY